MSSFKRKLARHNDATKAEADASAEHAAGPHTAQPRPNLKLSPRGNTPSLDRGRVLRRKSAGR
jgi:hypothetical protein